MVNFMKDKRQYTCQCRKDLKDLILKQCGVDTTQKKLWIEKCSKGILEGAVEIIFFNGLQ